MPMGCARLLPVKKGYMYIDSWVNANVKKCNKLNFYTTSGLQLLFCGNWSSNDAPTWRHFACILKNRGFKLKTYSPSLCKASRSYPCHYFSNCMWNEWCHVSASLMNQFPQNSNCILLNWLNCGQIAASSM